MKHVYILDDNYNGTVFGVGTYIRNLIAVLKDSQLSVTVVKLFGTAEQVEVLQQDDIRYIHIPSVRGYLKCRYYYRNIFYVLYPYIDSSEENILHLNYRKGLDLVVLLKQYFNFKIILTWHYASWIEFFREKQAKEVIIKILHKELLSEKENAFATIFSEEKKILAEYTDHVICVAQHASIFLRTFYMIQDEKISLVYNALPFLSPQKKIDKIREKLHISATEKIVLCVGRLDENKNPAIIVRCFDKIYRQDNSVSLWIVGRGNYDASMVYGYPNYKNIIYTGFCDQEELHDMYEIADVGIIPSYYEEFGYVAVEMMMHGLPVIANRTSGLAEIIEDGISGELLDLYDDKTEEETIDMLANAIVRLLADSEKQELYSKNARQRYLDCFGIDTFKSKMLAMYNEM